MIHQFVDSDNGGTFARKLGPSNKSGSVTQKSSASISGAKPIDAEAKSSKHRLPLLENLWPLLYEFRHSLDTGLKRCDGGVVGKVYVTPELITKQDLQLRWAVFVAARVRQLV